jgi:hypothetical protein
VAKSRTEIMEQLRKLFALSESSFEEEARTAALMAVRLIKEHGMEVRWPHEYRQPPSPQPVKQTKTKQWQDPTWPEERQRQQQHHEQRHEGEGRYVERVATNHVLCKSCGQMCAMGETVLVGLKTRGTTHVRCKFYWFE